MKKGFTLIELLAVIVILAIIALIATPIILGIIDDARIGSIEASANGYVDAVEYNSARIALNGEEILDGAYDVSKLEIDLDGEKPSSGFINMQKGKVISATLVINEKTVFYDGQISKVIDDKTSTYKEKLLNGADPVLNDLLVPVVILNDGVVTKANTKTSWYSYENKIWANAVMLFDTKTYKEGEVIPEENIKSYFVWIPKYSYKLFNVDSYEEGINEIPTKSNAQEIKIKFGLNETNDSNSGECTTPMLSGEIGNCEVGEYMTHPAFISFNTNGFWMSKFEATGSMEELTSKPNIPSLRNITVSEMFNISYNFNRNLDSHMIKNTEWGAVAYLSHSKYGINKEININNNSDYLTGYSATSNADQTVYPGVSGIDSSITQPYNTIVGYKASSTGNISGVYDMSGGNHEYTAAHVESYFGTSGFTTESIENYENKYFDIYLKESNGGKFNTGILGDATDELGPFYIYLDADGYARNHDSWYHDSSMFIQSNVPWFRRGGGNGHGIIAGQFRFSHYSGQPTAGDGFRFVLAF